MAKPYTQDEALKEVFEVLKPSNLPADKYNLFNNYRHRYEKGNLGQKGIDTLLTYFGFKKEVHYYKEREIIGGDNDE